MIGDPELRLMRPKMKNGQWMPGFEPFSKGFPVVDSAKVIR